MIITEDLQRVLKKRVIVGVNMVPLSSSNKISLKPV